MSDRYQDDAADWVARHLDQGREALKTDAWMQADSRRHRAAEALLDLSEDVALADAMRLVSAQQKSSNRQRRSGRAALSKMRAWAWPWPAAGWGLVAVVVIGAPAVFLAATPSTVHETARGEQREVRLADGSRLVLAGDSRASVRLLPWERDVTLERGEAFFAVAREPLRPFRVAAGQAGIEVLGTRFMVERTPKGAILSVEEGRVRIRPRAGGDAKVLTGGRRVEVRGGSLEPVAAYDADAQDWRDGWLEVADRPLAEVLTDLGRWLPAPVRLSDPAYGDKRVTGRFRLSDPEAQLENLAFLHGLTLTKDRQGYRLSAG